MHDRWLDRLSEYLDGELDTPERTALEEHLRACPECTRTLAELELVVAAGARAENRPPGRDLWPGIAARLATPSRVLPLPRRERRLSFTLPQLAAAAALFLMLGAGGLYLAMQGERTAPSTAQAPTAAPAQTAAATRLASQGYATQATAITELEQALAQDRDRLDTATVRVLEQSIASIDQAIAEARAAMERDPANPYLRRYLDGAMKKKIDILRRAVTMRRATS